ncbi:hypothetical protein PPL_03606 [Heterostelium album PN500]|uniref:Uncharacterized protein n=1 Tax=Heterostelium pallidum (strain ATCC 26659 / Pp 5 / PN500) TaxID=670386 RepID=D3B593_HETP5|nr:hypothetical protein PPL_03606 [Heterostelium album PN500]EFA83458.1 hypothetical protein PPL_03606 [Heterostelium album PN500]|eukprot:XP_020435575.1 hypothetical protein PPL_03606 [Heterostelium album PN500]
MMMISKYIYTTFRYSNNNINTLSSLLSSSYIINSYKRSNRYYSSVIESKDIVVNEIQDSLEKNSNSNSNVDKIYSRDELKQILNENSRRQNIGKLEDWYNVGADLSKLQIPNDVWKQFRGSLYSLLSFVEPDFKWEPWKFNTLTTTTSESESNNKSISNPRGFWKDQSHQLLYMKWLAEQLSFDDREYERWYTVGKSHFIKYRGRGLLSVYGDSVYLLLSSLYPEFEWLPWKFDNTPKRFWSDRDNQIRYIKWLARKLEIKQLKDWYRITKLDFQENYGSSLLSLFGGSPARVVMTLIDPKDHHDNLKTGMVEKQQHVENKWQIWRFTCLPRAAKLDIEVLREFIQFAESHYAIESQADWYRLSWSQIRDIGGFSLVKKNGGFCQSLAKIYPEKQWNPLLFNMPGKKSSQRLLKIYLDRLLHPDYKVVEDYRDVDLLRYRSTNTGFQLDFYCSELKLAFEYQGKQHFLDTPLFGDAKIYRDRDTEKRVICRELGIKIIDIPYWWDNQVESLIGTIQENNGHQWISKYLESIKTKEDNNVVDQLHFSPIPKTYQKQRTNKKVHLL